MKLALYQPDIPQNTGTILRLGACLKVPVHLIEPAGFSLSSSALRRAGLDYLKTAELVRHRSFDRFLADRPAGRLVLLTTAAPDCCFDFPFRSDDTLLLGRETAGVPETVHRTVDASISITLVPGARSLNVALTAAMALGEALRQTGGFPTHAT